MAMSHADVSIRGACVEWHEAQAPNRGDVQRKKRVMSIERNERVMSTEKKETYYADRKKGTCSVDRAL